MKTIEEAIRNKYLTHILTGTREQLIELSTLLFDVVWKDPKIQGQLIDALTIGQISPVATKKPARGKGRPKKSKVQPERTEMRLDADVDEEIREAIKKDEQRQKAGATQSKVDKAGSTDEDLLDIGIDIG